MNYITNNWKNATFAKKSKQMHGKTVPTDHRWPPPSSASAQRPTRKTASALDCCPFYTRTISNF